MWWRFLPGLAASPSIGASGRPSPFLYLAERQTCERAHTLSPSSRRPPTSELVLMVAAPSLAQRSSRPPADSRRAHACPPPFDVARPPVRPSSRVTSTAACYWVTAASGLPAPQRLYRSFSFKRERERKGEQKKRTGRKGDK